MGFPSIELLSEPVLRKREKAEIEDFGPIFAKARATLDALEKFQLDIEKALCYGNQSHSFSDIVARVLADTLDMYVLQNSVILMELSQYPNHSVYHGFIAAGKLEEILDYEPVIMREALIRGAKYISIAGRRGWEKPLKEQGWKHSLTIMQKEVSDG